MKNFLRVIVIFCIGSIVVSSLIQANILVDDFSLSDVATRTVYVGTLSVTPSVGRAKLTDEFEVRAVAWSPDAKYIASSRTFSPPAVLLLVQDSKTLRPLAQTATPADASTSGPWIRSLSWSVTNTSGASFIAIPMATSDSSNNVYVYKFNGNSLQYLPNSTITTPDTANQALSTKWSPNGQYLAVATGSYFNIYSFDGSRCYLSANLTFGGSTPISGISWSYDGKYVGFVGANANAQIYSFDGTSLSDFISTPFIEAPTSVNNFLFFHPTQKFFALSRYLESGDLAVSLYSYTDTGSVNELQTLSIGSENPVFGGTSVAWSPDGAYFAAGVYNIYFYSFDGITATNIPGATISSWSANEDSPIEWSPDGRYLALGSRTISSIPPIINGISDSSLQLYSTDLNPEPSLAEAQAQAPSTLTNIVTSTADQFWGIDGGDLKFSSTEAVITRMRGRWEAAWSQGSLASLSFAYLLNNSLDGNFYALDQTGKVHQATSVIVGPQARINWQVLSLTSGMSPVFVNLFQGLTSLMSIDNNNNIYKYRPSSGWLNVGTSPL